MKFEIITPLDELWNKVRNYAENCSWKAGKSLANAMDNNEFKDWERVIAAVDENKICGYCTVAKTDCIQNVSYTPYIGFIFVDEKYRGNRLSEKLIEKAKNYLKNMGFDKVYLVSDHDNLYEKYGFCVIDRKIAPWGTEQKIYMQNL
ncbi:MAG: GNAT family N-acetyltransferase [Clostridia bacterium]|nr:GNAT family N-acetyltransferase [Clostridia bacterium]